MSKCAAKEWMNVIQRRNSAALNAPKKTFKIVDGISCGNCKSFSDERCTRKKKAVKDYNICERHEPKATVHL